MSEKITINYSIALILNKVCEELLYEKTPDGQSKERNLPFRLKYRITKGLNYLSKDAYNFEKFKTQLLANYGTYNPETGNVELLDETNKKLFIKSMNNLLTTEVTHTITKLEPSDLDELNFTVGEEISYNALKIFQAYFCNEPDLLKELNTEVVLDFGISNQEEASDKLEETKEETPSATEEVKEEPKEEIVEKPKKTTTVKKTSTTRKKTSKKKVEERKENE